ncbi:MAG TPA: methyltransferase domain-containing protein [Syntrophales bacterium]|nr:methyltransferase domain-containing protein [Syntrophales bacterium]HQN77473.1 methyltransferase domain-containing protein [Syntrophales bacterium]HQQ27637.1 methyltransferase domain-containing protein [Syntrophales bacterium]
MDKEECRAARKAILEKYRRVSHSAEGAFRYPTGRAGARGLGYDPGPSEEAPGALADLFCGVGNPFSLGRILPGEIVLDAGCGGGFDLFCAAKQAGPRGKAFGIDMTREMVIRAAGSLAASGPAPIQVAVARTEEIPFRDGVFDRVLSNGALNLSPEKERSLSEIFRVLKPGGRFQLADMVLKEALPEGGRNARAWSD